MEATLKRLLQAEAQAEKRVDAAKAERARLVEQAIQNSKAEEQQFERRVPELHADFLQKAENRANQAVGELRRRYEERLRQLRLLAQEHKEDALKAAVSLILKTVASEP
jgi:vacuolar-type H+-ATPase subunit H